MALPQVEAGSEVLIRIKIFDQSTDPPSLFNPATSVQILLARPDESIAVSYDSMTAGATGRYSYAYQTAVGDQAGIWTVQIKTTDGSSIVIRSAVAAFELLSTTPAGAVVAQGVDPAPANATYITQTSNGDLTAEQALASLATGYMKVTTSTGVVSSQVVPIPATDGGTGLSTLTQGDLLYASAANTLTKLAKDTNATRVLTNTGASNNPAWAQVNLTTGVTGTLPIANGGNAQTLGNIAIFNCAAHGILVGSVAAFMGTPLTIAGGAGTEANVRWRVPVAGTIIRAYTTASAAPGGSDTFTYRIMKNGATAGSDFTATGATATAEITGQSISVAAGDTISIRMTPSATAAAANHMGQIAIQVTG